MALLKGAGKILGAARTGLEAVGRSRPGRFIGRHPGMLVGGAALAGLASANPFQAVNGIGAAVGLPLGASILPGIGVDPFGTDSEVMGALLGDPNASRDVSTAAIGQASGLPFVPRSERVNTLRYDRRRALIDVGQNAASQVDGSLVFGLWNERLR